MAAPPNSTQPAPAPDPSNPFIIDPASPQPFAIPLLALQSLFYPRGVDWDGTVVPQLYILSVLYALYILVAIGCIATRWRRAPFLFFKVVDGYLMPSTAIIFSFFSALMSIGAQIQIWRFVTIFRDQGSYKGLWITREFTWVPMAMAAWTQIHGVFIATSFNSRATARTNGSKNRNSRSNSAGGGPGGVGGAPGKIHFPDHIFGIRLALLFNFVSIGIPFCYAVLQLILASLAEAACERQYDHFKRGEAIANQAIQQGISQPLVLEWYAEVQAIQGSGCKDLNHVSFAFWLVWLSSVFTLNATSYFILSRKLKTQITLLRHSARTFRRAENADAAALKPMASRTQNPPSLRSKEDDVFYHGGSDQMSHSHGSAYARSQGSNYRSQGSNYPRSQGSQYARSGPTSNLSSDPPYISYADDMNQTDLQRKASFATPKQNGAVEVYDIAPGLNKQIQHQLKRANGLEMGLNNLSWQCGTFCVAALIFIAQDAVIFHINEKAQTDAKLSAIVNLWALWIYTVTDGPALLLLFLIGLAPDRHSFLGIPLQPVAPDSHSGGTTPDRWSTAVVANPPQDLFGNYIPQDDEEDDADESFQAADKSPPLRPNMQDMVVRSNHGSQPRSSFHRPSRGNSFGSPPQHDQGTGFDGTPPPPPPPLPAAYQPYPVTRQSPRTRTIDQGRLQSLDAWSAGGYASEGGSPSGGPDYATYDSMASLSNSNSTRPGTGQGTSSSSEDSRTWGKIEHPYGKQTYPS